MKKFEINSYAVAKDGEVLGCLAIGAEKFTFHNYSDFME